MTVPLRVDLLGCGVGGSAVVRLMHEHRDDLAARVGAPLELVGIAVRRPGRVRDLPVDPSLFTSDAAALVKRDDIDLWRGRAQSLAVFVDEVIGAKQDWTQPGCHRRQAMST